MAKSISSDTERRFDHANVDDDAAPSTIGELPRGSWPGVVRRAVREFSADNITDWAAALTYFGVLSIFPMLLVLVSVLGLLGQSVTQSLIDNLGGVAPGPAKQIVTSAIGNLQRSQGSAGVLFVVGLLGALWSASGYVAAFMRASNDIWDVEEGRPIWRTIPVRVGVTTLLLVLLTICALAVVLTGPLAREVGGVIGLGSAAVTAWDIAKWPVLVVIVSLMIMLLNYAAPNVKHPKLHWVTLGSVLAVVLWIAASALFAFYVANFGSYNKTYGAIGGVIVFLTWLWITNIVILLGAEVNAEVERERQIRGGLPEGQSPSSSPVTPARCPPSAAGSPWWRTPPRDGQGPARQTLASPHRRRIATATVRRHPPDIGRGTRGGLRDGVCQLHAGFDRTTSSPTRARSRSSCRMR